MMSFNESKYERPRSSIRRRRGASGTGPSSVSSGISGISEISESLGSSKRSGPGSGSSESREITVSLGSSGPGSSGPGSSGSSGPGSSGPGSSGPGSSGPGSSGSSGPGSSGSSGSSGTGSSVSSNASSISNYGDYEYDYNQVFDIYEFENYVIYLMNEDTTAADFDLGLYHQALLDAYDHYLANKHTFDGPERHNSRYDRLVRCGALLQIRLIGTGKPVPGIKFWGQLIIIFAGLMWNIGFDERDITIPNWNRWELHVTAWIWDHRYGEFNRFFGFIYYLLYKAYWAFSKNICRTLFGQYFNETQDGWKCFLIFVAIFIIIIIIILNMIFGENPPNPRRNQVVERPSYDIFFLGGGPTDSIYEKILQLLDSDQPIKSMVDELIDDNNSDINIVNKIISYVNDIPGFMEIYSKTPAKVFKSILEELNSTGTTTIDEVKSILQKGVDSKLITKEDMEKSLNDGNEPKTILKFDELIEIIFKLNGSFMARNFPRKSSTVSPKHSNQRRIKSAPAALTSSGSMTDKNMNYKRASSRSKSRESRNSSRLPSMHSTRKSRLPSMRSTRSMRAQ